MRKKVKKILSSFCIFLIFLIMPVSLIIYELNKPKEKPPVEQPKKIIKPKPILKKVPAGKKKIKKDCKNPYSLFLKIHWPYYLENECGTATSVHCCHTLEKDPGGFTCYGLARKYNKPFYKHIKKLIEEKKEKYTLHTLSEEVHEKASITVFSSYYMKPKINRLYYSFRQPVFDFVVNSGKYWGIRKLQASFNLKQDSHIGTKTIEASKEVKDPSAYLKKRAKFLRQTLAYRAFPKGMQARIRKDKRQTGLAVEKYNELCNFK